MTPDFFITPTDTLLFELPSDMMVCLGLIEPSFPTSKIHGRLIYQVGYDVQNMNVEILVPDGVTYDIDLPERFFG